MPRARVSPSSPEAEAQTPDPFFKHLDKTTAPDAAIYLTDGYGDFPKQAPQYPTLWVITPGGLKTKSIPFGELARLLD
jgi:predicted metal-dependent peptidase